MRIDPSAPIPADQATSDPALLVPTDSTTDSTPAPVTIAPVTIAPVTIAPVTIAPVTIAPVTISEIAEFLRHVCDLSTSGPDADPDARAAFLHRKAELFTRLDPDTDTDTGGPAGPPATGRDTP